MPGLTRLMGRQGAMQGPMRAPMHGPTAEMPGASGAGEMPGPGAMAPGGVMGPAGMMGPMGAAGMMANVDVDRHFIQEMIPHHEDAIAMAALALKQAEHPELKALAAAIARTQTDEIAQMRAWYAAWYGAPVPPSTMEAMRGTPGMADTMGMMGAMGMGSMMGGPGPTHQDPQALDGAAPFDKAFIEQMVPHHQMAVMMAAMALQGTQHPELRELLVAIIQNQSAEIQQMRQWYLAWYGG
jgi:uncharacterized protein (DUF305 family)